MVLLEKTTKLLTKVLVSGGGRCNVTHDCRHVSQLLKHYPRGGKFLRSAFNQFGVPDTIGWFESRGVRLKTEADGRMFPITDNSATIARCLEEQAYKAGVEVHTRQAVTGLHVTDEKPGYRFRLSLSTGDQFYCRTILVATGGSAKPEAYEWLAALGHGIESPVPSLFTFNTPSSPFIDLPGISVSQARVKIAGHKLEEEGPVLLTHWGFSGPAVLRLSAWGARLLHTLQYRFQAQISWVPKYNEEELRQQLAQYQQTHPKRIIAAHPLFSLPQRLWRKLAELAGIQTELRWTDASKKSLNRLVEGLLRTPAEVAGKTTFKEEFVTCGGISLSQVNPDTMESKIVPGLFFAGEVLDIDGITGGFNFQAAWATAHVAGTAMAAVLRQNNR